jgi:hypothetical protein
MTRLSQAELEEIKARNPLADVAGGYVKLRQLGGRLVGPCPICGGRATSQRFEIKDGDSWLCAVCPDGGDVIRLVERVEGVDFRGAIDRLGGRVGIDPERAQKLFEAREKKRLAREAQSEKYREAERKRLWRTWQQAASIHSTLAVAYLAGRGLRLPAHCPGLRYLPTALYFHGDALDERGRKSPIEIHRGPAMVAAFIRPDGRFGGLHMTWLSSEDPPRKAVISDPETGELLNPKKMRGSKTNARILIAGVARVGDEQEPASVALPMITRLIVGEGIETVLSVWTAFAGAGRGLESTAFWAAGDLGNMAGRAKASVTHPTQKRPNGRAMSVPGDEPDPDDPGLAIPDSVEELILLGDGDSDKVLTECAMRRAARRYARPGRTIRIAFAPDGMDFNDVLRGRDARCG